MAFTDTEIINFDIVKANTQYCTLLTVVFVELNLTQVNIFVLSHVIIS